MYFSLIQLLEKIGDEKLIKTPVPPSMRYSTGVEYRETNGHILATGRRISVQLNTYTNEYLIVNRSYDYWTMREMTLPVFPGPKYKQATVKCPEIDVMSEVNRRFAMQALVRILNEIEDRYYEQDVDKTVIDDIHDIMTEHVDKLPTELKKPLPNGLVKEGLLFLNLIKPSKFINQLYTIYSSAYEGWGTNRAHLLNVAHLALVKAVENVDIFTYDELNELEKLTNNFNRLGTDWTLTPRPIDIRTQISNAMNELEHATVMTVELHSNTLEKMRDGVHYNLVIPSDYYWG